VRQVASTIDGFVDLVSINKGVTNCKLLHGACRNRVADVTAAPAQSTGAERPAPKRVRKNPDTRRAEIVATARHVFAATGYAE
jgi:hypothetical protein